MVNDMWLHECFGDVPDMDYKLDSSCDVPPGMNTAHWTHQ